MSKLFALDAAPFGFAAAVGQAGAEAPEHCEWAVVEGFDKAGSDESGTVCGALVGIVDKAFGDDCKECLDDAAEIGHDEDVEGDDGELEVE